MTDTKPLKYGVFHDELNELIESIDSAIAQNEKNLADLKARREAFIEGRAAVMSITDPASVPQSGNPEAIRQVETP